MRSMRQQVQWMEQTQPIKLFCLSFYDISDSELYRNILN